MQFLVQPLALGASTWLIAGLPYLNLSPRLLAPSSTCQRDARKALGQRTAAVRAFGSLQCGTSRKSKVQRQRILSPEQSPVCKQRLKMRAVQDGHVFERHAFVAQFQNA